jgi:hypothetical protein
MLLSAPFLGLIEESSREKPRKSRSFFEGRDYYFDELRYHKLRILSRVLGRRRIEMREERSE